MNSAQEHRREGPRSVSCMVITVSDTRTAENDRSGALMKELLLQEGHTLTDYRIMKDEYQQILQMLRDAAARPDVDAVLLNGGTGIAYRDTTYEAVRHALDKEMPGFGELFRFLSFQEDIGTAAILSRATAGVIGNTAVFSIPGSTGAVRLAMTRIILPELGHVLREINKDPR